MKWNLIFRFVHFDLFSIFFFCWVLIVLVFVIYISVSSYDMSSFDLRILKIEIFLLIFMFFLIYLLRPNVKKIFQKKFGLIELKWNIKLSIKFGWPRFYCLLQKTYVWNRQIDSKRAPKSIEMDQKTSFSIRFRIERSGNNRRSSKKRSSLFNDHDESRSQCKCISKPEI